MCSHSPSPERFLRSFLQKATSCAAAHRRFLCELSFAPFVSKESGVPNCALQNRCKPTEIKTPKPLVHFFFLPKEAQKEKVPKKKNAAWRISLVATSDKGSCRP